MMPPACPCSPNVKSSICASLRVNSTKKAGQVLRDWADGSVGNPDTLLLIRTERLQLRQRSSAWFKALEGAGTVVLIWPLAPRELPPWLEKRLQAKGLTLEPQALQALAERVEGNLLAAAQEVEKLALQNLAQPVTQEALLSCLEDTSRFNSFDLIDAAMAGQGSRVSKILSVLREDKGALFAVLGALTSQLRRLGETRGLPPARARTMEAFARRGPSAKALLAECAVLDQQGKGQRLGRRVAWAGATAAVYGAAAGSTTAVLLPEKVKGSLALAR